jgi:hypothetical protein
MAHSVPGFLQALLDAMWCHLLISVPLNLYVSADQARVVMTSDAARKLLAAPKRTIRTAKQTLENCQENLQTLGNLLQQTVVANLAALPRLPTIESEQVLHSCCLSWRLNLNEVLRFCPDFVVPFSVCFHAALNLSGLGGWPLDGTPTHLFMVFYCQALAKVPLPVTIGAPFSGG